MEEAKVAGESRRELLSVKMAPAVSGVKAGEGCCEVGEAVFIPAVVQ